MKILIIYDSVFGSTEKIAKAVYSGFVSSNNVNLFNVNDLNPEKVQGIDLLIVGSPNQNFKPLPTISDFTKTIPDSYLKGLQFAAFDTRLDPTKEFLMTNVNTRPEDYAGWKLDKFLSEKGAKWVISPEGFIKEDREGPLKEGEEERAKNWAKKLIAKVGAHLSSF